MRYKIDTPGSLAGRIADGRWKKLLLFLDGAFLPQPGVDYRFNGGELCLAEALDRKPQNRGVLVIIDPLDGDRWLYQKGTWERVGSLIA